MRYVVTGAAGFIGSHLTEALEAAGHEVVGIDCFTDYYSPALKRQNVGGRAIEEIDLARDSFGFAGCDGVFHLAGQPGVRSFGDAFASHVGRNVLATQRVLEAAVDARVRVVFASSSSVYGAAARYPTPEDLDPQPRSPYGITKLSCEHLLRAYASEQGLDAVCLRYFTIYGPRQRPDMFMSRAIRSLLDGAPFTLYGDGLQSRSFTYVADAVEATMAAMEQAPPSAIYNVGGGEEETVRGAIDRLADLSGLKLQVVEADRVPGDVRRTCADVSAIATDLGWRPSTPLAAGLAAQLEWARGRTR